MSDFEKLYYEEEGFWEGEMLQDEHNKQRIEFTAAMIPGSVNSLADIGCGNGVFVNYLQQQKPGLDIMAVDRSRTALKFVNTNKMEGDISSIDLADRSYDCVTCLEVIEHLPQGVYQSALKELTRIAKDYVIISVPYDENLEQRHNQCPSCKTVFNHDLHLRSFSDETMESLLNAEGFTCVQKHHLGLSLFFKGHLAFRKMFYKQQFHDWRSPICPLCGYKEEKRQGVQILAANRPNTLKNKLIPIITYLPKLLWPKEKKYYWIIGLYKRK